MDSVATSDASAQKTAFINQVHTKGMLGSAQGVAQNCSSPLRGVNDAGITVAGSESSQQFHHVQDFPLETEEHVIVLRILGETEEGKTVSAPVTVKAKPQCTTCGRINKATSKFCSDCGTALVII